MSPSYYCQAEDKEFTLYTHLYITREDAEKLFKAFARKPLGENECGVVTHATLDEHFAEFGQTYLGKLGATLEQDKVRELFMLKFRDYLPHLPKSFDELGVTVVMAEIFRYQSAPTQAKAGYYESPERGMTALVERVFPKQDDQWRRPVPLYAQNIRVTGPGLYEVQQFNTKLSQGWFTQYLVNAFDV